MDSPCDTRHHAWPLFLKTHSLLVDRLDADLQAGTGLPLTWFDVLVHVAAAPNQRVRMNDLSESLLLSKSGITRLVDRMVAADLIMRSSCASDRRVVYAKLTTSGRDVFNKAAPIAARGVQEHFARYLGREGERVLVAILSRVIDAQSCAPTRSAG